MTPAEEDVREAPRSADDSEVGINIVDLGLICRVDLAPRQVHVELTMTSPACPMGDAITEHARRAASTPMAYWLPGGVRRRPSM